MRAPKCIRTLQREHKVRIIITIGCVVSTLVLVIVPEYTTHGTLFALLVNFIWIWEA